MKRLILLPLLVILFGCDNNDEIPYDPVAQLQTDLNLIDAYLADNGQAVNIHPTGIRYSVDNLGQGDFPVAGDSVTTQYDIYTLNGRLVDTTNEDMARAAGIYTSNKNYGQFVFELGGGYIIEGFEIGTSLLNTNAEGFFFVPSTLAYGNSAEFGIGSNEILRIRIEVLDIF